MLGGCASSARPMSPSDRSIGATGTAGRGPPPSSSARQNPVVEPMALNRPALAEGVRGGIVLSIAVILLAILGLTPSLSWIPEVPLIAAAIAAPVVGYALTGYRAGRRSGRIAAGGLAGTIAGGISGGGRHRLRTVWQAPPQH